MNNAPTYVELPHNQVLLERINNAVDVVVKNGLEFENLLKRKQVNNPDYSFLFDGEGSSYYRYLLNIKSGKFNSQPQEPPPNFGKSPTGLILLSNDDLAHFRKLLKDNDGSKNFVFNTRNWILEHEEESSVCMALEIRTHILSSISSLKKLYTIYLINDSIIYSFDKHSTQTLTNTTVTPDAVIEHIYISEALLPQLPIIFHCVYNSAQSDEEKNKVGMVLDIWLKKKMYLFLLLLFRIDDELYKSIKRVMLSSQTPLLPGDPFLSQNPKDIQNKNENNENNNNQNNMEEEEEEESDMNSSNGPEILPDEYTPIPRVGQMANMLIERMKKDHSKYKPINHALPVPNITYDRDELDKKEKEFYRRYEKLKESYANSF